MLKGTNPNNVCNQNVIQKTFIGTPHSNYCGNSVIHEVLNIFIYIYIIYIYIYYIYIIISYYFKFHATSNLQATLVIWLSCYVTIYNPTCRFLSSFITSALCVIFDSCYSPVNFLLNEDVFVQF